MTSSFNQAPMQHSRLATVNDGWRFLRKLSALLLAFVALGTNTALAERVVILRATGSADATTLGSVETALGRAVTAIAHETATAPSGGMPVQTASDLRAIADAAGAQWVIAAEVHEATPQAYWVRLRTGYAPSTRIEELDAEVRRIHEGPRLEQLLSAMLRPEGLSDDGYELAGEDREGRVLERDSNAAQRAAEAAAAEEAARRAEEEAAALAAQEAAETERRAQEEAEAAAEAERLAQEAAENEAAAAEAFESRDRYGVADGLTSVMVGLGVRPLLVTGDQGRGGTLGTFEIRAGRGFEAVPGLELRGGLDLVFGNASGFTIQVGGAYLASPFAFPLHIGGSAEIGLLQTLSGGRSTALLGRVSAVASYNITGAIYAEASLPELMYLSAGGGALSIGVSLRAGARF